MTVLDTWQDYQYSKTAPQINDTWSYGYRKDHQLKAIDKPRYCKKCGRKLSRYNLSKHCWSGSCEPKTVKPPRYTVVKKSKTCQMCGDEITRGKYCVKCHNMFSTRRQDWRKAYPNIGPPDRYVYRPRGANSRMEDYL